MLNLGHIVGTQALTYCSNPALQIYGLSFLLVHFLLQDASHSTQMSTDKCYNVMLESGERRIEWQTSHLVWSYTV